MWSTKSRQKSFMPDLGARGVTNLRFICETESVEKLLFIGAFLRIDFLNSLFKLYSGQSHVALTAAANDAHVAASAHDGEPLFTAGMGLFQFKNIAYGDPYDV